MTDHDADQVIGHLQHYRYADGELPTWVQRARDGALYGYDENGAPIAGVDRTGSVAA